MSKLPAPAAISIMLIIWATLFMCITHSKAQPDSSNNNNSNFCQQSNPCGQGDCFWLQEWSSYLCDCANGEFTMNKSCITPTSCLSNVCLNGGSCVVSSVTKFKCLCKPGYSGRFCEGATHSRSINPCEITNPCMNGGTCERNLNSDQAFICSCPPQYSGTLCEKAPSRCATNCIHGQCIEMPNDVFCDCNFGWTGKACNISLIGQCSLRTGGDSLCKNGGECVDVFDGKIPVDYVCKCPEQYKGRNCEIDIYQICRPAELIRTCPHGGYCSLNESTGIYQCICTEPFNGTRCDQLIPNLITDCEINDCQNGGKCYMFKNDSYCQCFDKFTGHLCETLI